MKSILTDFAENLTFGTAVLVEKNLWSVAFGAFAIIRNIALTVTPDRLYGLVIILVAPLKVLHKVMVISRLNMEYRRELIYFERLIFWGVRVIKSPLFERDVLADKVYQLNILLIE